MDVCQTAGIGCMLLGGGGRGALLGCPVICAELGGTAPTLFIPVSLPLDTPDSWVMCTFFCKPFIGYQSNPEQTTNCQLSVTTSYLTSPISLTFSQAASSFCRHNDGYFVSPMLDFKKLAHAISPTVLQCNSLPSNIHHIQSSHAFKTVLKTHLYKQCCKWFQIAFLTCLPYLPFLTLHYIPSVRMHACLCACVWETQHYDYIIYSFWGFNVYCWSCKVWCAHPCQWDTVVQKWPQLLFILHCIPAPTGIQEMSDHLWAVIKRDPSLHCFTAAESLHCCWVSTVVFSDACSNSKYSGHHLLCPPTDNNVS